jgi:Rod binding domain-containing protein
MIARIAAIPPTPEQVAAQKANEAKIHKAATEFESMMVRQLLSAAHAVGKDGGGAYGDMANEALASGIERGGGLGLTRAIEDALSQAARAATQK